MTTSSPGGPVSIGPVPIGRESAPEPPRHLLLPSMVISPMADRLLPQNSATFDGTVRYRSSATFIR